MQSSRQISPCHRHGTAPYLQQQTYVELLRGLFKEEQSKDFVKLAYITGILPIKKYGSESALNNFYEFTMTNPQMLDQYIGFTEREVSALCGEYGMDFPEAAWWYDGYSFRRMKHVYNPNSVVRAMLSGEYDNYWTRTAAYESLKDYICMDFDGLKETVVQVLAGGQRKVDISGFENDMTSFRHRDDVLTALIHLGYLGWLETFDDDNAYNYGIELGFSWNDYYDIEGMDDSTQHNSDGTAACTVNYYGADYTECVIFLGRATPVVSLLKKPSTMFSQEPWVGVNTNSNLPGTVLRYSCVSLEVWAE